MGLRALQRRLHEVSADAARQHRARQLHGEYRQGVFSSTIFCTGVHFPSQFGKPRYPESNKSYRTGPCNLYRPGVRLQRMTSRMTSGTSKKTGNADVCDVPSVQPTVTDERAHGNRRCLGSQGRGQHAGALSAQRALAPSCEATQARAPARPRPCSHCAQVGAP